MRSLSGYFVRAEDLKLPTAEARGILGELVTYLHTVQYLEPRVGELMYAAVISESILCVGLGFTNLVPIRSLLSVRSKCPIVDSTG